MEIIYIYYIYNVEKQFGMKSTETAWVFSGNEISQIFFIVVLPFLSRIKKRTLWTSVAMVFSGFGKYKRRTTGKKRVWGGAGTREVVKI